ncbi:MAG: redoxin domain-containing protein [Paludisphaera borealis]|uniref:redoxin domain-containing protein n=1 Tax=Paludisphaera borealis TaxID=1387353 RepID=UPI0028413060|nr:redoxin domain-containing protein [Paludisphaera borealis]MDR3620744.1 redoxin domain-containing protein [Paludisphaera borealis]
MTMRDFPRWVAAAVVAGSLCWSNAPAKADEPTKPTPPASESNPAVPAAGHSLHGEAFNDGPRRQAGLTPGMGKVRFAVTTGRPEAQAFIDQGVGQLHSFFYFEAERSFRQAAKLDPDCAMAYWGMAMANVNNARRAKGFLKEARKRAAKIGRREQLYIEALEAFHAEGGKEKDRRQGLVTGLETIVQDFPDDFNAVAWLAMTTWQHSDKDGIGSRQAVDFLIDRVIEAEPMHPGAHHYRIHLWDSNKSIRAARSAALYAKTAPGIAHAWHMPGHTYTNLKRFADAAYQQEGSARVDHAYMARERVMPFEIHNYAHNNQWLCTSDSHIGRVHDAIAVARNLVEQPRDPEKNGPNDGGSAQRSGRIRWAELLTRYELWDDLIAADASGALDWSNVPIERKEKAYSLGLAFAARNDSANLAKQIEALKKIAADESKAAKAAPEKSADAMKPYEPALAELEGRAALAKGEIAPAFEHFARASSMRGESLARAHLSARNYGFAETVARKAVDQNPDQLPPLAALVEVLHAVDKDKDAQDAYRRLEPLTARADHDLPVLRRLEPIVARWKTDGAWKPAELAPSSGADESAVDRIDLTTLGPLVWSPFPALPFAGVDTTGKSWSLPDLKGKTTIVVFFLGGKCAHCMQQLQLFGKEYQGLKKRNIEMLAISTDAADGCRELKNNTDGVAFPMPILADPKLENFRRWGAFDDFEDQPLHGTFLIDAEGGVRFQRISADPFLEIEFLKTEAARVIRLLDKPKPPAAG